MGQVTQTSEEIQNRLDGVWPKTEGTGFKVDDDAPTFPWVDLIGKVIPSGESNPVSPSIEEFRTGVKAFAYNSNDELICTYHVPHDWLMDSDALIHVHWGHHGTAVSGAFTVTATAIYGDRDGTFSTPVTLAPITHNMDDIATTPQYSHVVTEVNLCTETPTGNEFDRADINVDGVFQITFKVTALPTITGGVEVNIPFIFTADIHHQSTGLGTKNNAAPFYT